MGTTRTREDYGFFGPGSPTWKVWTSPTAIVGFQRSVVLEHFDPNLAAAVADMQGIYKDPQGRLDRTLAYFLTVAVADGRTAIEVADHLMTVHAKATGIEPISGKRYSANNPASQLWIHVTGWHSVLKCYEMFGPGPLSPAEEQQYWADCVVAAELQTCKPADVPTSRAEVREYFAAVRPQLCTSERADEGMHYLLHTPRANGKLKLWAGSRLLAPAVIATLPQWMRDMGRFDQPRVLDATYTRAMRVAIRGLQGDRAKLALLGTLAPMTKQVLERHIHAEPPLRATTITPADARARYGSRVVAGATG
ncbi:oxygenase MpaB family protein [Antrihabitans stalactiti]|uniref:DUF2236 domain-containing protein n=1 Tax=Antrihabitans stalactiti TaxID=2584121 RepID=A0A848KLI4_9NOCA|nr:oxygenase MpaB family protein [Antrihabitans stalactiti]NMN98768.1 DUF2236 domain-containing protein [Antrihabitans stalactiti]